jgi:hypothetical protein
MENVSLKVPWYHGQNVMGIEAFKKHIGNRLYQISLLSGRHNNIEQCAK